MPKKGNIEKLNTYKVQVSLWDRGVTPFSQNSFSLWEWTAQLYLSINLKHYPSRGQLGQQLSYMNVYANEDAVKQGSLKNLP